MCTLLQVKLVVSKDAEVRKWWRRWGQSQTGKHQIFENTGYLEWRHRRNGESTFVIGSELQLSLVILFIWHLRFPHTMVLQYDDEQPADAPMCA
jgi:hypothetical protein